MKEDSSLLHLIIHAILQFLEAYKNERKYFRVTFEDGHELTQEVIKYIDNSLSKFIQKLLNDYFTDKTAFIILSDHGAHIPGPHDILVYEEKLTEKYLGLLILILPNKKIYNLENIIFNQQKMIINMIIKIWIQIEVKASL